MTATAIPTDALKLAAYPGYAITPDGDIWNLSPSRMGRFAGSGPRMVSLNIHPRGRQWTALLKSSSGKWERRPVRQLLKEAFGEHHGSPRFPSSADKLD